MGFLVISCSLNPSSRSRVLARTAFAHLRALAPESTYVDLRDYPLPQCDADTCYSDPNVLSLGQQIRNAAGVLLAVPIYNYAVGASAKNLLEVTGDAWTNKIVGFACAAGGSYGYMSVMGLANSLMLDYRCLIVPRFVYVEGASIQGDRIVDAGIAHRITGLVDTLVRFGRVLDTGLS